MAPDDALFAGLVVSFAATPGFAQQTPATYCASLPATSCEILNVEPVGLAIGAGWAATASFLVKQCRNRNFETRIVTFNSIGGNGSYSDPFVSASPMINTIAGEKSASSASFQGRTTTSGSQNVDLALGCL